MSVPNCPVCKSDKVDGEIVADRTFEHTCQKCGYKWKKYHPD